MMQMKSALQKGLLVFINLFLIMSCTTSETIKTSEPLRTFSSEQYYPLSEKPQCKGLLDQYCNFLYSPDTLGNVEVKRADGSMKILQGETRNQFSQVFVRYSRAKIKNEQHFPKDFNRILLRHHYFEKLKAFIDRHPRGSMSVGERLSSEQLDYELGYIWSSAVNETVILRMNKQFPGFHQTPDQLVPIELQIERRRQKRNLISEISKAIWHNDENWRSVEESFSKLRESYVRTLIKLDIPDSIRTDWTRRIAEVQLVLPGAFPEISNEECSTTTINAYYYTYLNVITICAGDFNSEDVLQTLAHEMGHALGLDRGQYLFEKTSDFGKQLLGLRKNVCSPEAFSCEKWNDYKSQFGSFLQSLNGYKPELPEFNRCLKRRVTSNSLADGDIQKFSRSIVADRISELASNDRFLRITKPQLPMKNGKNQKNPNYLNPCSYYLWNEGEEPIDDELTTLMFFTAEYRCSEKVGPEKLKNAIETSKEMTQQVISKALAIEGEFSGRNELETQGFSSPPFERFADVIGSYAMAEYLSVLKQPWDRRNKFLASTSWVCIAPSLASHFPDESSIEKEYIFDSHTEGDQRKKELFSLPIREVIGCEKDFEFDECKLPFKK